MLLYNIHVLPVTLYLFALYLTMIYLLIYLQSSRVRVSVALVRDCYGSVTELNVFLQSPASLEL